MMTTKTVYPLSAIRALALHTQHLDGKRGSESRPTPESIFDVIEKIGCVQIDTLQMVHRSHYVIIWSRLGRYDTADLDRLVYGSDSGEENERRCFEYWMHAACIIPLTRYRYRTPIMRNVKNGGSERTQNWLTRPGHVQLVKSVRQRIRREGPLRVSDFEYKGPRRESWWDWKPAKRALEYLFDCGDMMIANRINFQRVYDLRERVLPDWVDTNRPTQKQAARHTLELSMRALGVCVPSHVAAYTHDLGVTTAKPYVEALIKEGVFVEVQAKLADDSVSTMIVHRDNLPLLEQAADGALKAERTTFLNPFDPIFYPRGRDQQLWKFRQVLEAYKPETTRIWGYFCLPILHKDRLIGRFDPKLERKTGTLRLKALYLEPGVKPSDELIGDVAASMRDFMAFHNAKNLVIERSQPVALKRRLLAVM